jgi:hypothetical protein
MNAQSVALEAATIRQQCKVLRMPTIAAQWSPRRLACLCFYKNGTVSSKLLRSRGQAELLVQLAEIRRKNLCPCSMARSGVGEWTANNHRAANANPRGVTLVVKSASSTFRCF